MNLHDSDQAGVQIVRLRFFGVKNLHWICSARDGENGGFVEILRELDGVQRSGCYNQLHVRALLYSLRKQRKTSESLVLHSDSN